MKFFVAEEMKSCNISDWTSQPLIPEGIHEKHIDEPMWSHQFKERDKLTKKLRYKILRRDGFRCVVCGKVERLEIDHVLPVAKGGLTEEKNLRTLCHWCNQLKRDKTNGSALKSISPESQTPTPAPRRSTVTSDAAPTQADSRSPSPGRRKGLSAEPPPIT